MGGSEISNPFTHLAKLSGKFRKRVGGGSKLEGEVLELKAK